MSDTLIENLQTDNSANPGGSIFRPIGGLDSNSILKIVRMSRAHELETAPGPTSGNIFGRYRNADILPLFDSGQTFAKDTVLMVESLTGGGTSTFSAVQAAVSMTLTTANGDKVVRQSKQYIPYLPGRTQLIMASAVLGPLKANVTQRVGLFDDNNGVFFEQDGTNFKVVVRSDTSGSPVDTAVTQANFNIDKADGTGQSGITFDPTKINLFIIDFAWLGAGDIRFGLLYQGKIRYLHEVYNSNTISLPWCGGATLPIRYEIKNTGTAASPTTLLQICCAAFSEGLPSSQALLASVDTGTVPRNIAAGSSLPIIALRLKSGFTRGSLYPVVTSIFNSWITPLYYQVTIGGTLTGGSFNATSSVATEYNVTATSSSGGLIIDSGYISPQQRVDQNILMSTNVATSDFAGTTADIICINVTNMSLGLTGSTGNANCLGVIQYLEVYK